MSVTLRDIADRAGVSQMTASRALRGLTTVNDQTRRRIQQIARDLGYLTDGVMKRPAVRTRSSDKSVRQALRLLVAIVTDLPPREVGHALTLAIIRGIEELRGQTVGKVVYKVFRHVDDLIAFCRANRIHGVIMRSHLPDNWLQQVQQVGPVVYATAMDFQCGVDVIYSNEHRAAACILDHLVEHGHRSLVWFGLHDTHTRAQNLVQALGSGKASELQAMTGHGVRHGAWANLALNCLNLAHQELVLVERDWRACSLEQAIEHGLERVGNIKPAVTAIVTSTLPMAMALHQAATRRGLRVPQDLSLVCYAHESELHPDQPAFTRIELAHRLIGRVIPELIERRLADPHAVPLSLQVEATLVPGQTVARLSHR